MDKNCSQVKYDETTNSFLEPVDGWGNKDVYYAHKSGTNIEENKKKEKEGEDTGVKAGIDESKAVFLGNLSHKVTEEEVRILFEKS